MAKKDKEKAPDAEDARKARRRRRRSQKGFAGQAAEQEDPDDRGTGPGGGAGGRRRGGILLPDQPHNDAKNKVAKADESPLTPPQVAFSDVPDMLVNIQSNDGTPAYLKLSLSLEMDNDLAKTGMQALMPRLVDQFQSYLRELRLDDLRDRKACCA